MKDHEAVQRFFLQEIQLGEELLAAGDLENGVDHLGNAVAVCGQPNDLLQVLQQTLQPNVFHLLIQRLPAVAPRLMKAQTATTASLQEDDVEWSYLPLLVSFVRMLHNIFDSKCYCVGNKFVESSNTLSDFVRFYLSIFFCVNKNKKNTLFSWKFPHHVKFLIDLQFELPKSIW